jgi:2-amino-4-hydroxy-6-hydroxymethyldihydropteridine diphosphokinase
LFVTLRVGFTYSIFHLLFRVFEADNRPLLPGRSFSLRVALKLIGSGILVYNEPAMTDGAKGMWMPHQLFLGLGSNLGDRWAILRRAVQALADLMVIEALSPVYETEPWGLKRQPYFLNLCLAATTALEPLPLLAGIKRIEARLGRKPGLRWGPRLVDIDILFYDNLIMADEQLTIPHPRLAERAFVLAPLADLAPHFRHPGSGFTVGQMLAMVDQTGVHRLAEPLFEEAP